MKFTKKVILAFITGIIMTASAIPSFAQQESIAYVTIDSPSEIQSRAEKMEVVTQKLYWHKNKSGRYEVGTVDFKVTYGYNSITQTGSVNSVEIIKHNINEDFEAYPSTTTKNSILIYVKNLEPANISDRRALGVNRFDFPVSANGSINVKSITYFENI